MGHAFFYVVLAPKQREIHASTTQVTCSATKVDQYVSESERASPAIKSRSKAENKKYDAHETTAVLQVYFEICRLGDACMHYSSTEYTVLLGYTSENGLICAIYPGCHVVLLRNFRCIHTLRRGSLLLEFILNRYHLAVPITQHTRRGARRSHQTGTT